jgi:hypothetical protein
MDMHMADRPHLAIKWTDATDADKGKALAAINAAFAAIGMTTADGAIAAFAREGAELDYMAAEDQDTVTSTMTPEQHDAARLWDRVGEIAATALGKPPSERLPGFNSWIEPWITEEQINQMKFL